MSAHQPGAGVRDPRMYLHVCDCTPLHWRSADTLTSRGAVRSRLTASILVVAVGMATTVAIAIAIVVVATAAVALAAVAVVVAAAALAAVSVTAASIAVDGRDAGAVRAGAAG